MSIIFDFKAIRQAASALGIRTIGEEDRSLPVAVQEQPQQVLPVPQCAPWHLAPRDGAGSVGPPPTQPGLNFKRRA